MVEVIINGEFKIVLPQHRADRSEWYEPEGWEKIRTKSMADKTPTSAATPLKSKFLSL